MRFIPWLLLIANFAAGAVPAEAFAEVYGPSHIATAALSPDGRHLAQPFAG
jgi:hypothetical protein